jgi:hypothetical protein
MWLVANISIQLLLGLSGGQRSLPVWPGSQRATHSPLEHSRLAVSLTLSSHSLRQSMLHVISNGNRLGTRSFASSRQIGSAIPSSHSSMLLMLRAGSSGFPARNVPKFALRAATSTGHLLHRSSPPPPATILLVFSGSTPPGSHSLAHSTNSPTSAPSASLSTTHKSYSGSQLREHSQLAQLHVARSHGVFSIHSRCLQSLASIQRSSPTPHTIVHRFRNAGCSAPTPKPHRSQRLSTSLLAYNGSQSQRARSASRVSERAAAYWTYSRSRLLPSTQHCSRGFQAHNSQRAYSRPFGLASLTSTPTQSRRLLSQRGSYKLVQTPKDA